MATARACLPVPLLALAVWIAPVLPVRAQNMAAFVQQAQRCSASGGAQVCRGALEQSHRLKNWAEARKLWRCYTALLGAEAEMIVASRVSGAPPQAGAPMLELRQLCGR